MVDKVREVGSVIGGEQQREVKKQKQNKDRIVMQINIRGGQKERNPLERQKKWLDIEKQIKRTAIRKA